MPTAPETDLAALKIKTRKALIEAHRERSDLTRSGLNEALANLGLPPMMEPRTVHVEVITTKRTTVTVDDVATQEEAEAKVAGMSAEEAKALLRSPGGYVSHRVIETNPADDPLGWITIDECGHYAPRAQEARDAVAAEREAAGGGPANSCRVWDPTGTYRCSRGRGHVGQHVATSGHGYCQAVWPQPELVVDGEDPLGWIVENYEEAHTGSRRREAVDAIRQERARLSAGTHCPTRGPRDTFHCSRGVGHPGPHIAEDGNSVCSPFRLAIWT